MFLDAMGNMLIIGMPNRASRLHKQPHRGIDGVVATIQRPMWHDVWICICQNQHIVFMLRIIAFALILILILTLVFGLLLVFMHVCSCLITNSLKLSQSLSFGHLSNWQQLVDCALLAA